MSQHPYPDAGRALRQVTRHAEETTATHGQAAEGSFVKWPHTPEGWDAVAKIDEAFRPLRDALQARPIAVPQLVFRPGRTLR